MSAASFRDRAPEILAAVGLDAATPAARALLAQVQLLLADLQVDQEHGAEIRVARSRGAAELEQLVARAREHLERMPGLDELERSTWRTKLLDVEQGASQHRLAGRPAPTPGAREAFMLALQAIFTDVTGEAPTLYRDGAWGRFVAAVLGVDDPLPMMRLIGR
jgi:hypothetical protein